MQQKMFFMNFNSSFFFEKITSESPHMNKTKDIASNLGVPRFASQTNNSIIEEQYTYCPKLSVYGLWDPYSNYTEIIAFNEQ